jgi:hypothetical protein
VLAEAPSTKSQTNPKVQGSKKAIDSRLAKSMVTPTSDYRTPHRRALDEQIASEPPLPPFDLPADAAPLPVEAYLAASGKRPLALAGIVENGLVRPLDPSIRLTEHSRVIIVTAE